MLRLSIIGINNESNDYDFDGRVVININGKNKSTLKLNGIFNMTDNTERNILSFPLYSRVELWDNKTKLFLGLIKESIPQNISDPNALKPAKVEAYGFEDFLTNGILLTKKFKNAMPKDILNWVHSSLSQDGIELFKLDNNYSFGINEAIHSWTIQDASPYDILNELANRTNSRFWSSDMTIYMRSWESMIKLSNYKLDLIIKDNEIIPREQSNLNNLISLEYNGSSSFGYANYVIIRSKNLFSTNAITQTFRINFEQTSFTTDFPVGEIKESWIFNSKTKEWKKLFVRESKWTEEPYNQYWELKYTQGDNTIEYNDKLNKLSVFETIYVEYLSISQGSSIQSDNKEIERIKKITHYGDGKIVYIEQKDDITSQKDLDNYCYSILDKMSIPRKNYTYKVCTQMDWKINEIVMINSDAYVVENIDYNHLYYGDDDVLEEYTYNLTNTKNDNQQINFFDKRLTSDGDDDEPIYTEEVVSANLTMEFNSVKEEKFTQGWGSVDTKATKFWFTNKDNEKICTFEIPEKVEAVSIGGRYYGE